MAGLKHSHCDNVTALTRFLAAFRASEGPFLARCALTRYMPTCRGFTVNEVELLIKNFDECESVAWQSRIHQLKVLFP